MFSLVGAVLAVGFLPYRYLYYDLASCLYFVFVLSSSIVKRYNRPSTGDRKRNKYQIQIINQTQNNISETVA